MKRSDVSMFGTLIFSLLLCATVMGQRMSLVSVNSAGTGSGNAVSGGSTMSADGRYIAFTSNASDLVPNDVNGSSDVFVRDTVAGTTTLVSINNAGQPGNGLSNGGVISANGQVIAFLSHATNLSPLGSNDAGGVFVRNMLTGITSLASVSSDGNGNANNSTLGGLQISADGRFVAFLSTASNLVPNDTNGFIPDVFVRDTLTGTTTLVSASLNGGSGNSDSISFALSADGRRVAFISYASDLVGTDDNNYQDVFVRDLSNGTTSLVSVNTAGTDSGNQNCDSPTISADGRFIAFRSFADNLTANDTNGNVSDIFVRDVVANTTILVSVNRDGNAHTGPRGAAFPVISANGRVVMFLCGDSDLVERDNNLRSDYFARDLSTATTYFVSAKVPRVLPINTEVSNFDFPTISADGRIAVFPIPRNDPGFARDIYVRDLRTGKVALLNVNSSNTGSSNRGVWLSGVSDDGQSITFSSAANDLLPNVGSDNVYLFRNARTVSGSGRERPGR